LVGHEDVPWVLRCLPPRTLVTAARDGTVMVWDTDVGQCVRTIVAHSSAVLAMDVAHDTACAADEGAGVLVATGGADSLIKVQPRAFV
jgi:WD40 repeat protein